MNPVRILEASEDYERFGINPKKVEPWEDGRRDNFEPHHFEWWYFDAVLDDGTVVVVQFMPRSGKSIFGKKTGPAVVKFTVTTPDGRKHFWEPAFKLNETHYSTDRCDVQYGPHYMRGDLTDYQIHMEPVNGMGVDFRLHSTTTPWRPGTSYFRFGSDDKYYTWLCVVPRGEVTGTLTMDGKQKEVHGFGYHDHQWGSEIFHLLFNNWVWARQKYDDYSLLIFDMVSRDEYGRERFPLAFLQDKDGNIIFESSHNVSCLVLDTCTDKASDKIYPKDIRYVFENGGKRLEYTLKQKSVIESIGKHTLNFLQRQVLRIMKMDATHARYFGEGQMKYSDGSTEINRNAELIYEFMYPGDSCLEYMQTK